MTESQLLIPCVLYGTHRLFVNCQVKNVLMPSGVYAYLIKIHITFSPLLFCFICPLHYRQRGCKSIDKMKEE